MHHKDPNSNSSYHIKSLRALPRVKLEHRARNTLSLTSMAQIYRASIIDPMMYIMKLSLVKQIRQLALN